MGYDKPDTIWFETRAKGDDIVLEGRNTGGSLLNNDTSAINTGEAELLTCSIRATVESQRYVTSKDVDQSGSGKSCIGVQMQMLCASEYS